MENQKPKAIYYGVIKIEETEISCAVLENTKRILTERSVANALGKRGSGSYWQKRKNFEKGALLPEYVSMKYLQPYISAELKENLLKPIEYIAKNGSVLQGVSAEIIPAICDLWITAEQKGALPKTAKKTAKRAYILLKAFAKVGIIALIDEATGYQDFNELATAYKTWLENHEFEWFEPKHEIYGNFRISVKINPELGLKHKNKKYLIKLYFNADKMLKKKADIILELMQASLKSKYTYPVIMGILDIRRKRLFTSTTSNKLILNAVNAELNYLETFLSA